jgi:hypothetical protein
MGAMVSFVRNWLVGLGLFAGGTAAVCLALSFAIAGPPTDEEMAAISGFVADAMEEGGALAERAAASLCDEYDFCTDAPVTVAEAPAPTANESLETPAPNALSAGPIVVEAPPQPALPSTPLLGGREDAPRAAPERRRTVVEQPRPERRAPARRRAERSPRSAPLDAPRRNDLSRLAQRERAALADLPATYQPDLGPYQDQQTEVAPYEERDDYDGWEDDRRDPRDDPYANGYPVEEEEPEPYWYGY